MRNALALLLALAPLADDMHTGQYPQKAPKLKWNKMRVKWIKNESKVVKKMRVKYYIKEMREKWIEMRVKLMKMRVK